MATRQQLQTALINADKAGDTEGAKVLARAIQGGNFSEPQPAKQAVPIIEPDVGSLGAFGLSVGKGAADTVRGVENLFNMATGLDTKALTESLDIPTKAQEARAFKPLQDKHPLASTLGEITGEILATGPIGAGAGSLALKGAGALKAGATATRFTAPVAAGITEGAIVGAAEDQAGLGAALGGGGAALAEAALPPIAKRLKRYFGKAKPLNELVSVVDGKIKPTQETVEVFDELGLDFNVVAKEAQEEILNPKQAGTKAAFLAEGVEPASRNRLRPNVSDIQREGFLLRQSDSDAADAFREKVVNENEQIKDRFSGIADELGVAGETGEKLKGALFGIKSNMRSFRNQAYKDLADVAIEKPELVSKIPLNQNRLIDGVREASELGLDDTTETAVLRAFEDFGLTGKTKREGGLSILTGDREIEQLNVANLHKFRTRINNTFDPTKPKEVLARRSIINAIDDIELEVVEAFEDSTLDTPKLIKDAALRARQSVIDEKRVFDQADLINDLVKPKRAGLNAKESPLVAASKVYGKFTTSATPVESVQKLVKTLVDDGSEESLEALGNLQASTMMDLLDSSVQASKRFVDANGNTVEVFSGTRLSNTVKKIGEDKIKAIFSNNPEALRSISNLRKITEATITPDEAIQKGSIPPSLLNKAFTSISSVKGVPVIGVAGSVAEGAQTRLASRKLNKFGPSSDDLIDFVLLEDSPKLKKLLKASGKLAKPAPAVVASETFTENTDPTNQEQRLQELF